MVPVSLHNHSEYSLLESLLRLEHLVRAAAAFGMTHVGLTDRNSLSGVVKFTQLCRQYGVEPVVGCELLMEDGFPLVLLIENDDGYGNACELLSTSEREFRPMAWKRLERFASGLLCLTGGQDAALPHLLTVGRRGEAAAHVERLGGLFPGRLWVELTRHRPADVVSCLRLAEFAASRGLPLIAGANSRSLRPQEARALQMLGSIRTLTLFEEPAAGKMVKDTHGGHAFLSPVKFRSLFANYTGALENTVAVAQRCQPLKLLRGVC
jgi:DNA polymerase III alpha subunit